ncbi:hypothetical protein BAL199_18996 [alpha proteobacterium BAL199]|nr:hypothetical protein BAL199_18996 [alpha proteobacterium BAL199]
MTADPYNPGDWLSYSASGASEPAARLYDYWASKKAGPDDLPSREDIRPEEIKALLPYIWLLDFDRPSRSFRYRLIGTAVVDGVGQDHTGHALADCYPTTGAVEYATRALLELMKAGRPIWRRGTPMFHHHTEVRVLENLALPLAGDHRTPDMILGLTLFYDSQDKLYLPGVLRAR